MIFYLQFLSKHFDMKDTDEASYVIGTKIHRLRPQGILGLSQNLHEQGFKEISNENLFTKYCSHCEG